MEGISTSTLVRQKIQLFKCIHVTYKRGDRTGCQADRRQESDQINNSYEGHKYL